LDVGLFLVREGIVTSYNKKGREKITEQRYEIWKRASRWRKAASIEKTKRTRSQQQIKPMKTSKKQGLNGDKDQGNGVVAAGTQHNLVKKPAGASNQERCMKKWTEAKPWIEMRECHRM
jgi:hypothetical protein